MYKVSLLTFSLLLMLFTTTGNLTPVHSHENQEFLIAESRNGKARIIISEAATPTERYAAQELQSTLQKMSGALLPISTQVDTGANQIIIGTPHNTPSIKANVRFDSAQQVRIVRQGQSLYLVGQTPQSALHAVYTFLQDTLGARWFWPGESGEYLSRQSKISVRALDLSQTPDIEFRSLSINSPHYDEATLIWMARNRMNLHNLQGPSWQIAPMHEKGFDVMIGGHNAYLETDVLAQHPNYIAEVAGKRQIIAEPPHLCWSNVGVQEAMADKIARWWNENPTIDSISFYPADHNYFCECAKCQTFTPDVSTRWQKFSKAVIDRVNKTHPGKQYQTLAYQAYRDVPTQSAPFDLIGYTTYNINYTKPLTDPTNIVATREIKAWKKIGAKLGLRGYQFIPFNQAMYVPLTGLVMDEVAWAKQNGLSGWTSEVTPFGWPKESAPQNENWVTNRMALYAAAQSMWNSKLKPSDLIKDWTNHVYGPAATPMRQYHSDMEAAWRSSIKTLSYFLHPPSGFVSSFISDELLQKADTNIKAARMASLQEKDDNKRLAIEAQINLEAQMLENWRQLLLFQQGRSAHLRGYAIRSTTKPSLNADSDDMAWQNMDSLPEFEVSNNKPALESTKVLAQFDDDNLYLRFINSDANIGQLKARQVHHDSDIFGEDTIEMFIDNPARAGHYYHLAVSAKETRYDAKADGAMNFETSWNPEWRAKTSINADNWIVDVALPFASLGIDPKQKTDMKMSFLRSGAERRLNSGWPDATVHNPAGFGTLTLVEKAPHQKRVAIYDAGGDSSGLRTELARLGFSTTAVSQEESAFANEINKNVDAVVLKASGADFSLSEKFIVDNIQPFLRKGGLVFISTYGQVPLDKWFGPEATLTWNGWDIAPTRRTSIASKGNWMNSPHQLSQIIDEGVTPSSGFTPNSAGWEILAQQKLQKGQETAYLLTRKVGEGRLVITSSDFGYGGGHEMFGSMNPANAAMLLDNFLADHANVR